MLVPNERGLDRALELGCRHIAIFGSATETFAQRNLNRSLDEQFAMFEPTVTRAREAGLDVRAYVSMCFGDPWEGEVPIDQVVDGRQAPLRPRRQPALPRRHHRGRHCRPRPRRCSRRSTTPACPTTALAVHFHDTYGQALANAYAALQHGITTFDASAGGLGGCPYAESATGNLATEDLVWMLHGLGIETGVDLGSLVATSRWMAGVLGRPSPSRVVVGQSTLGPRTMQPMSRRRVYLHVGTPKSGTSYLQDKLALNRDAAGAAGARLRPHPHG